jgi:hypothetical protein
MQNDLTACEGPLTAAAAPIGRVGSRRRRMVRGLLALPLAMALIAPGATAMAAEATTGYGQTTPAPAPKTETTPAKQETAPTQTSSTAKEAPSGATEPTKTSSTPTATTAAKAKTLPFTGLDLRVVTLGGLLLVGMGMSIVMVQRRRHTGR